MSDYRFTFQGKDLARALKDFARALDRKAAPLDPDRHYVLALRELYPDPDESVCASCGHTYFDHANGTRDCDYRAHGNALECGCSEFEVVEAK